MTYARTSLFVRLATICGFFCAVAHLSYAQETKVSINYAALDQEVAVLLPVLATLSGEPYDPMVDLLVADITKKRATLVLHNASPATCRQAIGFALDCWWIHAPDPLDRRILLTNSPTIPQGDISVRNVATLLRDQHTLQPIVESFLKPWLGSNTGMSYLPTSGLWTVSMDPAGHRRFNELISLLERPTATISQNPGDPEIIDARRVMNAPIRAHKWDAVVNSIAAATKTSVAISPALRLRACPRIAITAVSFADLPAALEKYDVSAQWCAGVLCLGNKASSQTTLNHEHPAQRRRLGLIPIPHLLREPIEGEILVTALRAKIDPEWWSAPGAGLYFLPNPGALLIAADPRTQQNVLEALATIDRLGFDLGIRSLGIDR